MYSEKIGGLAIYENIKAKEPIDNKCLSYDGFIDKFTNYSIAHNSIVEEQYYYKKDPSEYKQQAYVWRPNAVYGNRAGGTKESRIIKGSGLYAYDVDYKELICANYDVRDLQRQLNEYKEDIKDIPYLWCVYKSYTLTGLHIILEGLAVEDSGSFKILWEQYRKRLLNDTGLNLPIDNRCKNIGRGLYIGSDKIPYFNFGCFPCFPDINKKIKFATEKQYAFAHIQCNIKCTITEEKRLKYIRYKLDYSDLEPETVINIDESFEAIKDVPDRNYGTIESYTIMAYLMESDKYLYIANNYVAGGKIPIGRRNTTLIRLVANCIWNNGYWICDNVGMVQKHFEKTYFKFFQQKEGNKYTKEEMNRTIQGVLNAKLLPELNTLSRRKVFIRKDYYEKYKISAIEAALVSKRYLLNKKIMTVKKLIRMLYEKDKTLKQKIKSVYEKGKHLFKLLGFKNYNNFRKFLNRYDINVTNLYITSTYNNKVNSIYRSVPLNVDTNG